VRLCILTHDYPVETETFVYEPVRWLRERGHDVAVVTRCPGSLAPADPPEVPSRVTAVPRLRKLQAIAAAPFHSAHVVARALGRPRSGLSRSELAFRAALPEVRRADCLVAHFGTVGVEWLPVAAAVRRPLCVFFHGYDATQVTHKQRGIYDRLFASGAAILTNSQFLRGRLLDYGAPTERLAVVRLAAAPQFHAASWEPAPSEKVLLSIARLVPKKGIEDSIAAFARAQDVLRGEWRYEIIGDGPLRAKLVATAEAAGVGGLVRFRGVASRAATLEALRRASVFVLASKPAPNGDTDGTPVSVIEAAAVGLPVISTVQAGIPEILPREAEAEGFLVEPGDVAGLAATLSRLAADGQLRQRWGDACRAHAGANHTPSVHIEELLAAIAIATRPPSLARRNAPASRSIERAGPVSPTSAVW